MATTQDDSFREIQLSGKHLVFLFMAGTVFAVVIFLSGVMVGRGVRTERGGLMTSVEASPLTPGAGDVPATAVPPPPTSSSTSSGQPLTAGEQLSYAERLNAPTATAEQLEKAEPPEPADEDVKASPAPAKAEAAAPPPAAAPAKPEPAKAEPSKAAPAKPEPAAPARAEAAPAAASTEPPGSGFAIQVAALREKSEADAIVKRLAGKGYAAYVLAPAKGTPSVYRVRVGKFKDRREADSVAARLQKEEQFKPWIVR